MKRWSNFTLGFLFPQMWESQQTGGQCAVSQILIEIIMPRAGGQVNWIQCNEDYIVIISSYPSDRDYQVLHNTSCLIPAFYSSVIVSRNISNLLPTIWYQPWRGSPITNIIQKNVNIDPADTWVYGYLHYIAQSGIYFYYYYHDDHWVSSSLPVSSGRFSLWCNCGEEC